MPLKSAADTDAAEREYFESLMEAREQAHEALYDANHASIDRRASIEPHSVVVSLHAAVLKFAAQLAPAAHHLDSWDEKLDTVEVPEPGTYDGGYANMYGEVDWSRAINRIDTQEKEVRLATLREEWREKTDIAVTLVITDRQQGELTKSFRWTAFLPVAVASKCVRQLEQCMSELNWLPSADLDRASDEPVTVPDHIKEQLDGEVRA